MKSRWFILLLLASLILGAVGCATTQNTSARPWNGRQGWETGGLPGGMMEGR